ncbi:MAG: FKBP-type peptidyl-prolyl cis-trans isomerase [Prevotella sp.]|nr:FKBP-type peptidyl-prolyl cis-trans isomerase [Prevotella sp.]
MKRFTNLVAVSLMILLLASCAGGMGHGNAQLTSAKDSLSYAVGVSIAQDYKISAKLPQLTDSAYREVFIKGVAEGVNTGDDKTKLTTMVGVHTAIQIADMVRAVNMKCYGGDGASSVNLSAVFNTFITAYEGGNGGITASEAEALISSMERSQDASQLGNALGVHLANTILKNHVLEELFGLKDADQKVFVEGIREGERSLDNKEKLNYWAGVIAGDFLEKHRLPYYNTQLFANDADKQVDTDLVMAGFCDAQRGGKTLLTLAQADACMERQQLTTTTEKFIDNKTAGEKFLAENKTRDGVQTTASGLQYKVLTQGNGPKPTISDKVIVNYEGRLIDGTVYDSSYERGTPMELGLGEVIDGWTEVLQLMPVGSTWEVYIPQNLAYGAEEVGELIKPFATLIFKIELLDIKK